MPAIITTRKSILRPQYAATPNQTDPSKLSFWMNPLVLNIGDPAPSAKMFWANSATVSNDLGIKTIKCPIISASTNGGCSGYWDQLFGAFPQRGDTVWFFLDKYDGGNYQGGSGWPGFTKWMRDRNSTAGSFSENSGAIYTEAYPDGSTNSAYEGFPDPAPYILGGPNTSVIQGQRSNNQICIVFDSVSKDSGGFAQQRFYSNNNLIWARTDQATLINSTDQGTTWAWLDFINGGALASYASYVYQIVIAGKLAGVVDDTPFMSTDSTGFPYINL